MSRELLDQTTKSRRPKNSPFFQQKLPAWQPMFTAKKSAIVFLVLGLIGIPLGVVLLVTSNNVMEYMVDYTDCNQINTNKTCSSVIPNSCKCSLNIEVFSDIPGPVFFYYSLKNFYQNHRRYVRSKNDDQLLGRVMKPNSLSSCAPFSSYENGSSTYSILPCGAIANSIFNDTISVTYLNSTGGPAVVSVTQKGIAWKSDINRKFGNLGQDALQNTVKPPNWPKSITERSPNPFKSDESLMVWMRISPLPNFRKLYGIVESKAQFQSGLPAGVYTIEVDYTYPVHSFNGRKVFIIANASWLGGKNPALGITCLLTGSLHFLLGIAFLVVHFMYGKQLITSPVLLSELDDGSSRATNNRDDTENSLSENTGKARRSPPVLS